MARTVVAIYDDFQTANTAVRDLVDNGFARDNISLIANNNTGQYGYTGNQAARAATTGTESVADETGAGAGVGAGIGAAIGGIGGLLIGLGALTIPGIGPVIAAGPLAVALSTLTGAGVGAVAGGVTGGLLGALIGLGIPEEEAGYYAEGVRRGGVLVTVQAEDQDTERIMDILNHHNPVDINERVTQWRQQGWKGFDPNAQSNNPPISQTTNSQSTNVDMDPNVTHQSQSTRRDQDMNNNQTIPDTGMVDNTWRQDQGMGGDQGRFQNRDQNQDWTNDQTQTQTPDTGGDQGYVRDQGRDMTGDQTWTQDHGLDNQQDRWHDQGRDMTSDRTMQDQNQGMPGDRTQMGNQGMGTAGNYPSQFDPDNNLYHTHYNTYLSDTGYPYDYYLPAYRYGYDVAGDTRYQNAAWNDIEPNVRQDWERSHPGTWDRFREAIRSAWEDVTGQ